MEIVCKTPEETFAFGEKIGLSLAAGDTVLLYGGLGAGKTLLTKGILNALDFDVDEVTSPSFTLVNLYKTPKFDVYHIDLWRLEAGVEVVSAVGLDEIIENGMAVIIIEWADRLNDYETQKNAVLVTIHGDGDDPREINVVAKEKS